MAYLATMLLANIQAVQEALKMESRERITFDEVVEKAGLTAKWVAQGEKTAWERVIALMREGYTADELERMAPSGVPSSV